MALLFSLLPVGITEVRAAGTTVSYAVEGGNIYFDASTGTVTDCDSAVTVANIPSAIEGVPVTAIGNEAFYYCKALTSITIPDSVTTIGDSAFYYCYNLTSITIPDSVTSIGDFAFADCSGLTSITIPDSVTTIGDSAFSDCYDLTSITIPDSVTAIGDSAFYRCYNLTSITIPDSVTTIGDSAFYYCEALTSIIIPDSVTSIGDYAFYDCDYLASITIPDSVTTIGKYAFKYCYVTDVYYSGTEAQWHNITIMAGNEALQNATIHYEPPHDHVWDAGKITTAATCVDAGVKTYTCTVCGGTMTETIPATGKHVDANKDNKCDSCGKDMAVPTDPVAIYNVAHGAVMTTEVSIYNFKEQLVAAPATLVDGNLSTVAENVALFKMETNDAGITTFLTEDGKYLEADGNNIRFVDAANANTEFVLEEVDGGYYIRLANYVYVDGTTGAEKPQYIEFYTSKNVYTTYGMGTDTSMYIFNFYPVEIPHVCTYDAGKVTTEATCDKAGIKTYTCTDCGATKEETIPATGHTDANADNFCDNCNKQLGGTPNPGTLADGTYVIAAYVDGSYYAMSNVFGSKINGVEITVTNGKVAAADAEGYVITLGTVEGYRSIQGTAGYLSYVSGTSLGTSETPYAWTIQAGATEGTWSVIAAATATASTVRGLLFQAGSNYRFGCYSTSNVGGADYSQIMFIPVCTYDAGKVTTEATCDKAGVKTYTCIDCGATKTEAIPATGHNYEITYSVEADCKWTGVIRYTCSNCGDVKTETLPALGHSFDSGTVTTPASCTEEGVFTYTCERCKETKTEPIPATGHSFDQGAVSTPATCTVAGVFTYTCEGCGETKTEPIPATGHLYVRYSNNGPNHSVMCAYCRNIYTEAHNFTAGDCICGAAEPAVDGSIQISHTLNLASDIAISYVIVADSLSGYDSYYMECVTPVYEGNTLVGSTTHILEPELRGSYYYFILDGLTSLEMNDMVEARLYMTKAGKSYTSEPDHYSIATYAYNKLNSSATAQDLKTVCANLLQYGSKAQLYKEYRTDALADGEMTAEHRSYLTDPTSVAFGNNKSFLGDHSAPTVTFVGAPLRLDSKIIVRYVIDTTAYKGNMEDLSLRISYEGIDGSIVTETLTDLELYYEAASYYAFDFDGLLASELRTVMSAVVYEGDTPVSETMTYSVDTYGNGRTGSLLTLIQAMMAYSDSCKVYFE